MMIFQLTRRAH